MCINMDEVKTSVALDIRAVETGLAENIAAIFKSLGDPNRVRIISLLLEHELCVEDIAAVLEMSQSAVSHQLRTLRQLRLVRSHKIGRNVFYQLQDEHIKDLYLTTLKHVACD
jgi:ArsR family transcriptional regulator, lead/cadmium/zinc/bismuth-responsive transcriptional repressor